ncbi:hypothetical protein LEMLEM_LOCUS4850, partial [Lemmus lemmus]
AGKVAGSYVLRLSGRALAAAAGQPTRSRPPLDLGQEPHSTRSGPARPDPRPRQPALWPAQRGHARPRNFRRGPRARTQGPGPARGVRPRSPRARARTARRVRGALPGPQAGTKQKKEEMSSKLRGVRETFLATKPFAGIYNFKTLQVSSTEVSG